MRVTPFRQYKGNGNGKAKMHINGILATAKCLTNNKPGK